MRLEQHLIILLQSIAVFLEINCATQKGISDCSSLLICYILFREIGTFPWNYLNQFVFTNFDLKTGWFCCHSKWEFFLPWMLHLLEKSVLVTVTLLSQQHSSARSQKTSVVSSLSGLTASIFLRKGVCNLYLKEANDNKIKSKAFQISM